ncbi:hypothetical protein N5C66_05875 [Rhizobium pusense]|uniref:hypothetical protein n=1 Tax=Agrobacterium pusense TaxID=648995 RepID=UPI002448C54E|nr:hypothetical protein [Agrobacterium pusense]MDH1097425.1 hypothetical protein [Agrobacterium pusense]MDH1111255.1 hypothetical protein [Agrobacterium pusense]MDH2193458.1 hypothetical protein [Agrobacterium pusense]
MEEEARLAILKELAKEDNKAMSSARMQISLLSRLLIDKPREWVETQYMFLKDMGAVTIVQADTVKIARLTSRGEHHLRGIVDIPGVMIPSAGVGR